ncbi:MAG: aldehyde dehydrogenase family protein, partial [Gordonia amarae]
MTTIAPQTSLFIGGGWHTPSSTETIPVISPLTETEIGSIPNSTTADVDAAVTAARTAFRAGRTTA